jgi:hypothetical protein
MPPPSVPPARSSPSASAASCVRPSPSPGKTFRVGVIFTAVLSLGIIVILALAGTHHQQSEEAQNLSSLAGVALLPGVVVMAWAFLPVILVLSIITMCRGGILRGILLLLAAPAALFFAVLIGASIVISTFEAPQRTTARKAPKFDWIPSENPPAASVPGRADGFTSWIAPLVLNGAVKESAVERIRRDAVAKLAQAPGLSDEQELEQLRGIHAACDARIEQIRFASERKRLR